MGEGLTARPRLMVLHGVFDNVIHTVPRRISGHRRAQRQFVHQFLEGAIAQTLVGAGEFAGGKHARL